MSTAAPIRPALVLFSTGLAMFAVFLDTTVLYVAFPAIRGAFPGSSEAAVSWVLNAYTIVFAALLIPAGRFADRIGRRRAFLVAVVVFAGSSLLCALAPTIEFLVAARVLQAVGAAAMVPASLALVLQSFPKDQIPRAVAIWAAIGAVAGAAGPTLGGVLIQQLDWRWVFFINLPVGLVSVLGGRRWLPALPGSGRTSRPDLIGSALVALAIALIALAIVETEAYGWGSWQVIGAAGLGTLLLLYFIWRARRITDPLLDLGLFAAPGFRWGLAGMLVFSLGFGLVMLCNILFLTQIWGFSTIQSGMAISIGPLIVALLAPHTGRLAGKYGQRALLIPGGLIWASGTAYLLLMVTEKPQWPHVYIPTIVITAIGVAMCIPQLTGAIVRDLPAEDYGVGSAAGQSVRNLGTTLGVALSVALTGARPGLADFQHIWPIAIACGLFVTCVALLMPSPRHVAKPATSAVGPSGDR